MRGRLKKIHDVVLIVIDLPHRMDLISATIGNLVRDVDELDARLQEFEVTHKEGAST